MDEFVIHVGYHKSASTFLQRRVFPALPVNYLYFHGPGGEIVRMVQSVPELDPERVRGWVAEELNKQSELHNITVLSHEQLSGHPHGHRGVDPRTAARNLSAAFPEARILVIIRNQFDYLASIYAYRVAVKGLETRPLEAFLDQEGELGLFDKLEYDLLIAEYTRLFGQNRVLVLPMEMLARSPESYLDSVASFVGVPPVQVEATDRVNVSTRRVPIIRFWRPVNRVFEVLLNALIVVSGKQDQRYPFRGLRYGLYGLKRRATRLLGRAFEGSQRLDVTSYSGYRELAVRYAESNRRLEAITGLDLQQYGYPRKSR